LETPIITLRVSEIKNFTNFFKGKKIQFMRYFFGTLRYFPSLAFSALMAEAQKPIEVHFLEMDRWGWFDSTAKQTHTHTHTQI